MIYGGNKIKLWHTPKLHITGVPESVWALVFTVAMFYTSISVAEHLLH
jgi:hypothetical protein